ncbi:MAG TPA: hypothetical protein VK983_00485 [Candidatus Limnocylindrales bacterium]|nr:hypothetical protein [Candidatus Limnocylindrales bacterium]
MVLLAIAIAKILTGHMEKVYDRKRVNTEAVAAYSSVSEPLQDLGIDTTKPTPAACGPGVELLYKYSCGTETRIQPLMYTGEAQELKKMADKFAIFDQRMQQNGWMLDQTDFRSNTDPPSDIWTSLLYNDITLIAYRKKSCYLTFSYLTAHTKYDYHNTLSCEIYKEPF